MVDVSPVIGEFPGGQGGGTSAAALTAQLASAGSTPSGDVTGDPVGASGEDWLLCAVVVSGKGLYVGEGTLGDLFCMLHTSDGVCRSRTAVTGMVLSPAHHLHAFGAISLPHLPRCVSNGSARNSPTGVLECVAVLAVKRERQRLRASSAALGPRDAPGRHRVGRLGVARGSHPCREGAHQALLLHVGAVDRRGGGPARRGPPRRPSCTAAPRRAPPRLSVVLPVAAAGAAQVRVRRRPRAAARGAPTGRGEADAHARARGRGV